MSDALLGFCCVLKMNWMRRYPKQIVMSLMWSIMFSIFSYVMTTLNLSNYVNFIFIWNFRIFFDGVPIYGKWNSQLFFKFTIFLSQKTRKKKFTQSFQVSSMRTPSKSHALRMVRFWHKKISKKKNCNSQEGMLRCPLTRPNVSNHIKTYFYSSCHVS
jgi:hypothetical protein